MMKEIVTFLFFLFWTLVSHSEVGNYMNLSIHIIETNIPPEYSDFLKDKISVLLSENGINSALSSNRFFIVAKPMIISQSITDSEPSMVSNKISITFRIGDVVENRVFSTFSQTYHGVGKSEQKAWSNAFAKIRSTPEISYILNSAKEQITAYYNKQSQELIKKAKAQAKSNDFDAALATLSTIPIYIDNYDEVRKTIVEIYLAKCDNHNEKALLSAKNYWASSQDREGATKACDVLSTITAPSSDIVAQANSLMSKIEKGISSLDKKEYELVQQKIANEHDLKIHEADNELALWTTAIQVGYDILCRQTTPTSILSTILTW